MIRFSPSQSGENHRRLGVKSEQVTEKAYDIDAELLDLWRVTLIVHAKLRECLHTSNEELGGQAAVSTRILPNKRRWIGPQGEERAPGSHPPESRRG